MITTLATNTYKAVRAVYVPASKLPKNFKALPVFSHLRLSQSEGRMMVTALTWDEEAERLDTVSEFIPARVEAEFTTCIPARPFKDWLYATLPNKEEKARKLPEQLKFCYDPFFESVTIYAGTSRAEFLCIPADEFPSA
jgi:DNA polymerase III sliding clamp (beta) subunit (PCNA family)